MIRMDNSSLVLVAETLLDTMRLGKVCHQVNRLARLAMAFLNPRRMSQVNRRLNRLRIRAKHQHLMLASLNKVLLHFLTTTIRIKLVNSTDHLSLLATIWASTAIGTHSHQCLPHPTHRLVLPQMQKVQM